MADIFISYANEDRERARALADALQALGWTVWWDHKIPAGKTFAEVIEAELTAARCVVVLWSNESVTSEWVREEADAAKQQGKLLPARLDDVIPPLGFRAVHAADLIGWAGATDAPGFRQLVADLTTRLQTPPRPLPPLKPKPKPRPAPVVDEGQKKKGGTWWKVIVVFIVFFILSIIGNMLSDMQSDDFFAPEQTGQRLATPPPMGVAAPINVPLQWHDHALRYTGTLSLDGPRAMLRAAVVDQGTGVFIGNYEVPVAIAPAGADMMVSATFNVPRDSTTPVPHTHTSNLILRRFPDGSLRLLQNCPRPGECY